MAPSDSAAAFSQPNTDLAMACGWGGSLRKMKEHGNPIIEGAEKESVVGKVFDVTSIPSSFGEENPALLAKFLKVTADMNAKYTSESDAMMGDIQKSAGMDLDGTKAVIGTSYSQLLLNSCPLTGWVDLFQNTSPTALPAWKAMEKLRLCLTTMLWLTQATWKLLQKCSFRSSVKLGAAKPVFAAPFFSERLITEGG